MYPDKVRKSYLINIKFVGSKLRMIDMKRLMILLLGLMACLESWAGSIDYGPWVTESREDRVTICWLSKKPGMAYVELY